MRRDRSLGAALRIPCQRVLNRGQQQQQATGIGKEARQDKQRARHHRQNVRGKRPGRVAARLQRRLQVALRPFTLAADQPEAENGRTNHDRKRHPKAQPSASSRESVVTNCCKQNSLHYSSIVLVSFSSIRFDTSVLRPIPISPFYSANLNQCQSSSANRFQTFM